MTPPAGSATTTPPTVYVARAAPGIRGCRVGVSGRRIRIGCRRVGKDFELRTDCQIALTLGSIGVETILKKLTGCYVRQQHLSLLTILTVPAPAHPRHWYPKS
jgi:hypothetical protein